LNRSFAEKTHDLRRNKDYHELEFWEEIEKVKFHFGTASTWPDLLSKMTSFFGRQPVLPDWIYEGAIIGVQGGTAEVSWHSHFLS